jgi:hypothetical protein
MLAGLVRLKSCVGSALEVGCSAVRFSEGGPHGLLTCVGEGGISGCEVALAEKVTFLFASVFMAEVDCFLDSSVDLGVFLFRACV